MESPLPAEMRDCAVVIDSFKRGLGKMKEASRSLTGAWRIAPSIGGCEVWFGPVR